MADVSVRTDVNAYRQTATLATVGTPVADGDGGWTQPLIALDPADWRCAIEAASVSSAERSFADTVIAQASYIMRGRFHSGITTKTQVQWTDRAGAVHTANVIDVDDPEGAGVETVIAVVEVMNGSAPVDNGWVQSGWMQ